MAKPPAVTRETLVSQLERMALERAFTLLGEWLISTGSNYEHIEPVCEAHQLLGLIVLSPSGRVRVSESQQAGNGPKHA